MSEISVPAAPAAFRTIDAAELAVILKKTHATVKNDLSRAPDRLPPPIRTGGRKFLWLEHKVLQWLEGQMMQPALKTIGKKRGRPTKVESELKKARAAGGAA